MAGSGAGGACRATPLAVNGAGAQWAHPRADPGQGAAEHGALFGTAESIPARFHKAEASHSRDSAAPHLAAHRSWLLALADVTACCCEPGGCSRCCLCCRHQAEPGLCTPSSLRCLFPQERALGTLLGQQGRSGCGPCSQLASPCCTGAVRSKWRHLARFPSRGRFSPAPFFGRTGEDEGAGSCGGSRGLPECRRLAAGRSACPGLHGINISLNAAPSSRLDRGDLWGCSLPQVGIVNLRRGHGRANASILPVMFPVPSGRNNPTLGKRN